jgi:hypothetical protein
MRGALVLQVAEGPGEVEAAVDAAVRDKASCLANPVEFFVIRGLVVFGEGDGLSLSGQDAPGVAGVGHDQLVSEHHGTHGRATRLGSRPGLFF